MSELLSWRPTVPRRGLYIKHPCTFAGRSSHVPSSIIFNRDTYWTSNPHHRPVFLAGDIAANIRWIADGIRASDGSTTRHCKAAAQKVAATLYADSVHELLNPWFVGVTCGLGVLVGLVMMLPVLAASALGAAGWQWVALHRNRAHDKAIFAGMNLAVRLEQVGHGAERAEDHRVVDDDIKRYVQTYGRNTTQALQVLCGELEAKRIHTASCRLPRLNARAAAAVRDRVRPEFAA